MRKFGVIVFLATFIVGILPAHAAPICQHWDFKSGSFNITQSNGYVLRITLGSATIQRGTIRFGSDGKIAIEGGGGLGQFVFAPIFSIQDGSFAFVVRWKPPPDRPNDLNEGTYEGVATNIKPTPDGGLVGDLKGKTFGMAMSERTLLEKLLVPIEPVLGSRSDPELSRANWIAAAQIFCRPENVSTDGNSVTEKVKHAASSEPSPSQVPRTGKVLARTGRAPTVALPSAIGGVWDTSTGAATYTVTLRADHDGTGPLATWPITVKGEFVNGQGAHQYDGTLRGTMQPGSRTLEYRYTQKNGATGSGAFTLSNDGNAITGGGKSSDGQSFTWSGTRGK